MPRDRYLDHLATTPNARGRLPSPASVRAARADLAGVIRWWEQRRSLAFAPDLLTEADVLAWMHTRQADGAANTTINRALHSLAAFCSWCVASGQIARSPASRIAMLPIIEQAPRGLPPEGLRWLLVAVDAQDDDQQRLRDRALITLLADCGLRSAEAAATELRDLDLRGGTITVRAGKGGAPRRVPLTQRARSTLAAFVADRCGTLPAPGHASDREPLLWGRPPASGRAWTPGMSTSAMRRRLIALRDAAIQRVEAQQQREPSLARVGALAEVIASLRTCSPHELRHGLAYRLRSDGVDLGVIRQILGHARLETTVRYGKPTERDVRAAMEERER